MDIILIKGLVVPSIIGVYDWERCVFQKLVFDLDIGYYYNNKVGIYSSISVHCCDYIDYQKISSFVSTLVKNNCFFLVESVAETVAVGLMSNFNIPWIRVKVNKIGAISRLVTVGVVVERGMKDRKKVLR